MHKETLHYASLLCTKFCHDLASALGASQNCIELLEESLPFAQEENDSQDATFNDAFSILKSSVHDSITKLKLYRIAYGQSSNPLPKQEILQQIQDYLQALRIPSTLEVSDRYTPDPCFTKIVFNLVLIVAECATKTGQSVVLCIDREAQHHTLQLSLPYISHAREKVAQYFQVLQSKNSVVALQDCTLKIVQIHLLHQLLLEAKATIHSVKNQDDCLFFSAKVPIQSKT